MSTDKPKKSKDTRFQPGQSGNAAGRPPGLGWAAQMRKDMEADWPAIREVLIAKAKDGDLQAIRLVAERICPPLRAAETTAPVKLAGKTLTEKAEGVFGALADGELAPGQASHILQALGALAKVRETDELARRIEALEARS